MKTLIALVIVLTIMGWSIPKPMESIKNYNVMLIHGAYGSDFRRSALHLIFPVILCFVMPASHPRSKA